MTVNPAGSARVGCPLGNMTVYHLIFADDICVFGPMVFNVFLIFVMIYTS